MAKAVFYPGPAVPPWDGDKAVQTMRHKVALRPGVNVVEDDEAAEFLLAGGTVRFPTPEEMKAAGFEVAPAPPASGEKKERGRASKDAAAGEGR